MKDKSGFSLKKCNIYVRSQEAGERVIESIRHFIEGKLKLIVNQDKSQVCPVNQTKFLGYTIQRDGNLSIAIKSTERLKEKVRTITPDFDNAPPKLKLSK